MKINYQQKLQLHDLYWKENLDMPEIAKMFGVSYPAIRSWFKKLNIPRRNFKEAQMLHNKTEHLTDALLKSLYESGKSQNEIAKQFGITQTAITFRMAKIGIPTRSKANFGNKNGMFGKKHSAQTIQKLRESNKKQFSSLEARERHARLTTKQIAEGRTGKAYNKFETKVANLLTSQGRIFVQQYRLSRYCFDFFIPKENTLIESHGTFWHADPRVYNHDNLTPIQKKNVENDKRKVECAKDNGYNIEVIWELDVP